VDGLLNVQRLLFEERCFSSVSEISRILEHDFKDYDIVLEDLRSKGSKFGDDVREVEDICNLIIDRVSETLGGHRNPLGGKYKVGLSSPSFVGDGRVIGASFDGRKSGVPLGVNISPVHAGESLVSLFNFASSLHYDHAFNGAVTDIMIERHVMRRHMGKISSLFSVFLKKGGMQLQVNVLDMETLKAARKNPAKFPDLIVRVWGFSAYFNDLPDEYKDLIIERCAQFSA